MSKGLFGLMLLIGLFSQAIFAETIAYFERDKLYVYDPSFGTSRVKIDGGTNDFQVGHHAVAFVDKGRRNKLYFASIASGWRKIKADSDVVSYQLVHDALVWRDKKGKVYRLTSLTPAATRVQVGDSRKIGTVLVYDDNAP